MKFRDPKTGEVFEDIQQARWSYCEGKDCVLNCALISNATVCCQWVEDNPAKAARMMGYEVVEEEEEPMEQTKKPHICEVLGGKENPLEVGERFTYPGMVGEFYITENGTLVGVDNDGEERPFMCASTLINCHDRILRKPRFTEEEVSRAKNLLDVVGSGKISRPGTGGTFLLADGKIISLRDDSFPSLRPGQSVALEDIVRADR